jgi:carnitine 3-dehydrogenase
MGTNLIYHLAGGESGMRHMLRQFGPALKWPWTKLEAPELTEALIDKMVAGTQEQAAGRSIRELERLRDGYLVAIQQVLKQFNIGAGATLRALEERLYADAGAGARVDIAISLERDAALQAPLRLLEVDVRPEWIDYNGHMTDSRYLQVFGDATDALLRYAGVDEAYRKSGRALFTAESHVCHEAEAAALEPLYVTSRVLEVDEKRVRLFHSLHRRRDERLVATAEQLYLHVSAGEVTPMDAGVRERLTRVQVAQAQQPVPPKSGRVRMRPSP